jgi:hypothetical protein
MSLSKRDIAGLAVILTAAAVVYAYRAVYIEPRLWGSLCAAAAPPLACVPRAGFLWLQRFYIWGGAALGLGIYGFFRPPARAVQIAAISVGIAAIANFNASYGALGAALALLGWISTDNASRNAAKFHSKD